MKTYRVQRTYTVHEFVYVKADNEDDAIESAKDSEAWERDQFDELTPPDYFAEEDE